MCPVLNVLNKSLKTIFGNYFVSRSSFSVFNSLNKNNLENHTDIEEDLLETDKEYEVVTNRYFVHSPFHNCFIINPYVKWGPKRVKDTNPQKQLQEAVALIRTLAPWKVHDTLTVPLQSLYKKAVFGSGTLEKLKSRIRKDPNITAVFINIGILKGMQIEELELEFGVPILDRYRIVMRILRLHAISTHARLQVALAELPYIRSRLRRDDVSLITSDDFETRKLMLQNREQKIKAAIRKLHSQRQLLRKRRKQMDYPVIAVVGYTNSGKTSLIKALTGDHSLQPKNHLFATLDVTMHAGKLPSTLEVLYVDTVGFIAEIPTALIECFVVTLEDAMLADVIIHVEDLSSKDLIHQRNHVLSTLENLAAKTDSRQLLGKIITVGSKCDIAAETVSADNTVVVSATTHLGIDILRQRIEEAVLEATERTVLTVRVRSGRDEMRWLYKNSTVISVSEDQHNSEYQSMKIISTKSKLEQFRRHFIKRY